MFICNPFCSEVPTKVDYIRIRVNYSSVSRAHRALCCLDRAQCTKSEGPGIMARLGEVADCIDTGSEQRFVKAHICHRNELHILIIIHYIELICIHNILILYRDEGFSERLD